MVIRKLHVNNNRCLKWTGCVTPKLRTYSANYYQMDFLVPSHVLFPACLRPHWPFFFNIFEETRSSRKKETNFVRDYKTFLNTFAKTWLCEHLFQNPHHYQEDARLMEITGNSSYKQWQCSPLWDKTQIVAKANLCIICSLKRFFNLVWTNVKKGREISVAAGKAVRLE